MKQIKVSRISLTQLRRLRDYGYTVILSNNKDETPTTVDLCHRLLLDEQEFQLRSAKLSKSNVCRILPLRKT
jgi:hypothetical protein